MDTMYAKLGIPLSFEFAIMFASLIWIRLLTITSVVPFLFGRPVPGKMRVGGALVLMIFLFPILKPEKPPEVTSDMLVLFALYMKEAFVGLCIGLSASLIFFGFEAAGRMVDNQRGASLARVLIPQLGTQGSLSGQFLFQLAIVLYLTMGGHLLFFEAVIRSYEFIPVFEFPNIGPGLFPLMNLFIVMGGEVLVMAMLIAAPVIIAILTADIILGLTNRVAPQINVWQLGFNIRGFIGILALFLSLTVISRQMYLYSAKSTKYTRDTIELLQGAIPEDMRNVKTPEKLKNIFVFEPTGEEIKTPSIWDKTIRAISKEELKEEK